MSKSVLKILFLTVVLAPGVWAGEEEDKAAIENSINVYVEAFNHKDAAALAGQWTENGDYMDATGRHVKGRETIQKEYELFFAKAPDPNLDITLTSIYFADEDLVIEDGYRDVRVAATQPPSRIRYTAVHVKKDGQWLVQSVRDAISVEPSNYDYLQGLDWAVGNWADESADGTFVQSTCYWTDNKNFLIRDFSTSQAGVMLLTGTQRIGWDSVKNEIRSWHFDSKGSFGDAVWTNEGNVWTVKSTTTLMGGHTVAQTHVITVVDANTLKWASKDRTMDGNPLPDGEEVTMKRQEF